MFRRACVFVTIFLPLFADEGTFDFKSEFFKMMLSLGMIIALFVVGAWWFRKAGRSRLSRSNSSSKIKILERRPLTPKSAVYLIEVEGKGIVFVESPGGTACLGEVSLSVEGKTPFAKILATKSQE